MGRKKWHKSCFVEKRQHIPAAYPHRFNCFQSPFLLCIRNQKWKNKVVWKPPKREMPATSPSVKITRVNKRIAQKWTLTTNEMVTWDYDTWLILKVSKLHYKNNKKEENKKQPIAGRMLAKKKITVLNGKNHLPDSK